MCDLRRPRREEAEQARGRLGRGQLRDRARVGRRSTDGVSPEQLVAAVESAGYRAALPTDAGPTPTPHADPAAALRFRLLVSAVLTLPVLALAMIPPLQFDGWEWVSLAARDARRALGRLAVPPGGIRERAPRRRDDGHAHLDRDPRRVGLVSDRASSLPESARPRSTSRSPRSSSSLILLGRYLEARAKRRAGAALRALLELGAKDVAVVGPDGEERRVPVEELRVGDLFVVRPGEKVATDGVSRRARRRSTRRSLTGESVPVEVGPGDEAIGATVNVSGRLVVRATRVGADTAVAQIGRLVTEAQAGKAPVQRLADRISAVFVPIVIAVAVATLGVLARPRLRPGIRLRGGRRRADHRLPVRARPRDADGAAGRLRPRCAARRPDQGPRGARADASCDDDRARQDRHRHRGADDARRRRDAERRFARRGAAACGRGRGRERASRRAGGRRRGAGRARDAARRLRVPQSPGPGRRRRRRRRSR